MFGLEIKTSSQHALAACPIVGIPRECKSCVDQICLGLGLAIPEPNFHFFIFCAFSTQHINFNPFVCVCVLGLG